MKLVDWRQFEIYFGDLNERAQKELVEFLGGENGNFDVTPIAVLDIEE